MIPSHAALQAARTALTDIETLQRTLGVDHAAATRELADADAALTHELGAERLGESSAAELAAARAQHDQAAQALQSIAAARAMLDGRLPGAQQAVTDATAAFAAEAALALQPDHARLARRLRTLVAELQAALAEFAQVDAVVSRIPLGTRTGASLLKAAGLDEDALTFGADRRLTRLTEFEILERSRRLAEVA